MGDGSRVWLAGEGFMLFCLLGSSIFSGGRCGLDFDCFEVELFLCWATGVDIDRTFPGRPVKLPGVAAILGRPFGKGALGRLSDARDLGESGVGASCHSSFSSSSSSTGKSSSGRSGRDSGEAVNACSSEGESFRALVSLLRRRSRVASDFAF